MLCPREPVWIGTPPPGKLAIVDHIGRKVAWGDPSVVKAAVRFCAEDDLILVADSGGTLVEDRGAIGIVDAPAPPLRLRRLRRSRMGVY